MSFFLSPFRFLFELIAFVIQAAFVYGLLLIVAIGLIGYGISSIDTSPAVEYVEVEKEVIKYLEKSPDWECFRIEGCAVYPEAKNSRDYCPTCEWK